METIHEWTDWVFSLVLFLPLPPLPLLRVFYFWHTECGHSCKKSLTNAGASPEGMVGMGQLCAGDNFTPVAWMGADVIGERMLLLPVFEVEGRSGGVIDGTVDGTVPPDMEVSVKVVTYGLICCAPALMLTLAGLGVSMGGWCTEWAVVSDDFNVLRRFQSLFWHRGGGRHSINCAGVWGKGLWASSNRTLLVL